MFFIFVKVVDFFLVELVIDLVLFCFLSIFLDMLDMFDDLISGFM